MNQPAKKSNKNSDKNPNNKEEDIEDKKLYGVSIMKQKNIINTKLENRSKKSIDKKNTKSELTFNRENIFDKSILRTNIIKNSETSINISKKVKLIELPNKNLNKTNTNPKSKSKKRKKKENCSIKNLIKKIKNDKKSQKELDRGKILEEKNIIVIPDLINENKLEQENNKIIKLKYNLNNSKDNEGRLNDIKSKLEEYYLRKINQNKKYREFASNKDFNFEYFSFYDTILKENNEDFTMINNSLEEIGNIFKIENTLFKDLIKGSNSIHLQIQNFSKEINEKNKYLELCKAKNSYEIIKLQSDYKVLEDKIQNIQDFKNENIGKIQIPQIENISISQFKNFLDTSSVSHSRRSRSSQYDDSSKSTIRDSHISLIKYTIPSDYYNNPSIEFENIGDILEENLEENLEEIYLKQKDYFRYNIIGDSLSDIHFADKIQMEEFKINFIPRLDIEIKKDISLERFLIKNNIRET